MGKASARPPEVAQGADVESGESPAASAPSRDGAAVTPPALTACGIELEQGERVVLFVHPSHKAAKLVHIIAGVILLVLIIGIPLLIYGVMYERWHLRFVILTNRRVIAQTGQKPPRWLYLKDVVDVRARRSESAGGGVIGAVAAAAINRTAAKLSKLDPKYWANTQAIVVQGKVGAIAIEASAGPERLGPALANAVWTSGYIDELPGAEHPS